jgi:hypothetical protein
MNLRSCLYHLSPSAKMKKIINALTKNKIFALTGYQIILIKINPTNIYLFIYLYNFAIYIYHTIQYNTIQYNTIQYNTIQYNTIQKQKQKQKQYSTIQKKTRYNLT